MLAVSRVVNYVIAALVAVQAASHAWMSSGIMHFVMNGGVFDRALMQQDGPPPIPEVMGGMIHGMNGTMIIPLVALVGLVVAILSKNGKVIRMAVIVLVLTAVQILLGFLTFSGTGFAFVHALNAMLMFAAALLGAGTAGRAATARVADPTPVHATV